MGIIGLKNPELILVTDDSGAQVMGGSQYWFPKEGFIPPGACGATTASNVLAYLFKSRKELCDKAMQAGLDGLASPLQKTGFLEFMKKIYRFTYPRVGGLMVDAFAEGIGGIAKEYGLPLKTECLRIPIARSKRPSYEDIAGFVRDSLQAGSPVAFLILSNGCVDGLDTWHWVTILALDEEKKLVQIADNCEVFWAEINTWLDTSIMGGSLVSIREGF